ncbi:MAG TPA: hypothetical protein VJ904_03980 [Tichowtungia sp.]|nr:hypothetical protein [Tichowtungia sp.]
MKLYDLTVCITSLLLVSCSTIGQTDKEALLFEDPMSGNWQENWFLDGENAVLEHRDGGLAFITEYTVNKKVDRAGFDAQHAVLWTRQAFEGDIRITYTYTQLPGCSWQKLIYVQAQGIGEKPYVEDIYEWRDERKVAVMSAYFNYMNLIGLSLRDQIRCKRYPWNDMKGNRLETEFKPRAENKGLQIGHELHVVVEKRRESILLRITDTETGELVVDHTWDLTDEDVLEDRDPEYVEQGRIGIRLMGGHKILMRDFNVTRLPED